MQSKTTVTESAVSFDEEVRFVLKKIKKRMSYVAAGAAVEYRITASPYGVGRSQPIPVEETDVLKVLERWGAIKIVNSGREPDTAEVGLSKGMNIFIAIYSLQVKQPKFDEVFHKYVLADQAEESGELEATEQPLFWNTKDRMVCYGARGCEAIAKSSYALILFLDVMWEHAGSGSLTNELLAEEYDRYCEKKGNQYKQNQPIPKYLRPKYRERSPKDIGKMADRCVKELRDLFGVPAGRFFPITNEGTLENAKWTWYKVSPIKPK